MVATLVLNFIRDLLLGLAWPAVVLIALITFRAPLAAALGSLRSAKFAGMELVLGDRAAQTLERHLTESLGAADMSDAIEHHEAEPWILAIASEINSHAWPEQKAQTLYAMLSRPQVVDGIHLDDLTSSDAPAALVAAQAELKTVGALLFENDAPTTNEGYLSYIRSVGVFTHGVFEWLNQRAA